MPDVRMLAHLPWEILVSIMKSEAYYPIQGVLTISLFLMPYISTIKRDS